jgi:hypothetical protein
MVFQGNKQTLIPYFQENVLHDVFCRVGIRKSGGTGNQGGHFLFVQPPENFQ